MYVEVGVGHGDALGIKDSLDILIHTKQGGPVIVSSAPYLQNILNSTFAVILHSGKGCGILQSSLDFSGLPKSLQNGIHSSIIGSGDSDIHTAASGDGVVDDLSRDNSAVMILRFILLIPLFLFLKSLLEL